MDTRNHKCSYCKKRFERPSDLKRHHRIHTGEKAFRCNVCGKTFSQSGNLLVHQRIHTGDKQYECNVCNKNFTQKSSLVRHKRTHTGETPFVCGKCGKAFSNPYHLVCHNRTHSGLKPYKCSICRKKFSQCSGLISHKRSHTGEKLFKCNICGKEYSQASGLLKHKRTHSGEIFTCNVCDKQFSKASNLVKHRITHTGGKYFDCNVHIRDVLPARRLLDCKRSGVNLFKFDIRIKVTKESYSDLLNETAPTVCREQSYQCELCGNFFASSELFNLHKEFHTGQQMNDDVSNEQLEHHLDDEPEANKESCDNQTDQTVTAISLEELYQCDFCERIFASTELFTLHKEFHKEQQIDDIVSHKQLEYHLDNKSEANKESSGNRTHETAQAQDKSYQCDTCEITSASIELLTLHKESHTEQQINTVVSHKQLECHLDNELDANEESTDTILEQTAQIMSQEESYQCNLCERIFASLELLTSHKEFHAGQRISDVVSHEQLDYHLDDELEADKPSGITYICAVCDEEFELADELFRHTQ